MKETALLLLFSVSFFSCKDSNKVKQTIESQQSLPKLMKDSFSYEPTISTLTGTLIRITFYGPSNFGEDTTTDKKEICSVLVLDNSINMIADSTDEFNEGKEGIKRIQVVTEKDIDAYIDKKVTVTGRLWGAMTGHHHTDVLLNLADIQEKTIR